MATTETCPTCGGPMVHYHGVQSCVVVCGTRRSFPEPLAPVDELRWDRPKIVSTTTGAAPGTPAPAAEVPFLLADPGSPPADASHRVAWLEQLVDHVRSNRRCLAWWTFR